MLRAIAASMVISLLFAVTAAGQAARLKQYSESRVVTERVRDGKPAAVGKEGSNPSASVEKPELDVIKIETELVIVPFRVTDKRGRVITDIQQAEVRIFEDDEQREIAWFSATDQPFTVALVLDMSYSSVFKLQDIQSAAKKFVSLLRPDDRVMVISFAEKPIVLCEATGDRRILNMAIEGASIASGTGLYTTLDMVLNEKLNRVEGRKAVVLFSDGVDTSSTLVTAESIRRNISESDALIYSIRYNTYDDVQKNRRSIAPVQYDENDRPYTVETGPGKGERPEDYAFAKEFLAGITADTGGEVHTATSTANLDAAFARIADELRKFYSLGYYPISERASGTAFEVKVRVYRPGLTIRTRERYLKR
ncbi:MAG: VWA domain-containing protein [Pyrinomonadaceae bacterium]